MTRFPCGEAVGPDLLELNLAVEIVNARLRTHFLKLKLTVSRGFV